MKFYSSELVMLHFNYAIIDEVDIILIDEARTPLIISWAAGDSSDTYVSLNAIIPYLSVVDYEIDKNNVQLFLQKLRMNIYNNSYKERLKSNRNLYDIQNMALVLMLIKFLKRIIYLKEMLITL